MKNILKNKLFLISFANDMLSNFGDVLYYLALMSYVMQLPEAKLAIAIVSVSETLPILTGFVMGYVADRTPDKIKTILYTLVLRVGLYGIVGLAMGFAPSLGVVLVAAIANFFSDLAGQYENGLHIPLSLRIVSNEDREASYSFRQGVSSVLSIVFQSTGAVLVSLMSYQALAFFNAGTFAVCALIMLGIRPALDRLLAENPIKMDQDQGQTNFVNGLWQSLRVALQECFAIPGMRKILILVPLLNGLFGVLFILVALVISQDSNFVLINPATTLAATSISILLGSILGSILGMTLLKNLNIFRAIQAEFIIMPVLFLSLHQHWIWGVFLNLFVMMVLTAVINPKLNALMVNTLPEEKLGMISGGFGTYVQLGSMGLRFLVSGLITILPVDWLSLGFLLLGLLSAAYAFTGTPSSEK